MPRTTCSAPSGSSRCVGRRALAPCVVQKQHQLHSLRSSCLTRCLPVCFRALCGAPAHRPSFKTEIPLPLQPPSLQRDGAEAFILDLRNNPGGLVNSAMDVAGLWMDGPAPIFNIVVSLAGACPCPRRLAPSAALLAAGPSR